MRGFLLDASALLAYLHGEDGQELVAAALPTATIGSVNLAEVVTKLSEKGLAADKISDEVERLLDLGLDVVAFRQDDAIEAGLLRPETRHLGLSLGDRACLALGLRLELPILHAERAWAKLDTEKFSLVAIRQPATP